MVEEVVVVVLVKMAGGNATISTNYNFVLVDNIATHAPMQAINTKDALNVAMPAIKPITGGPIKKPENPMVDTADNATPGDIFAVFPAEL